MRFLVDAQLPAQLARLLCSAGHEALSTSELPDGNRVTDRWIAEIADDNNRVVVTKDRDFRDSHLLARSPRRLLVVATGNITNAALLSLFKTHLDTIVGVFSEADFVEIGPSSLVVHRRHEDKPQDD